MSESEPSEQRFLSASTSQPVRFYVVYKTIHDPERPTQAVNDGPPTTIVAAYRTLSRAEKWAEELSKGSELSDRFEKWDGTQIRARVESDGTATIIGIAPVEVVD